MKLFKKVFAILTMVSMMGVIFAPALAGAVTISSRNDSRSTYRDWDWGQNRRIYWRANRPVVKIVNFENLRHRFWWWRDNDWNRDFLNARRIVIVDRNNRNNSISINNSNYLTGPYSRNVNRVTVNVDSDFFSRFSRAVEVSNVNDIDLELNTGNNTISANTVVGNISTGDIDVDIF